MVRQSPRAIALWAAAALVALVTAAVVASDLAALHRHAGELGPEVRAVIATRDLRLGTVVGPHDVTGRIAHRSELPRGTLARPGKVVGRLVTVPLLRGGFVAGRNLAPRNRTGLDGVVPAGMRAMRVVATDAVRPRPGSAVDVLATFDTGGTAGAGGAASSTVVVAAGVLVLTADQPTTPTSSRDATVGVTVLVTASDSPRVAFAAANGVVTIALVPPEDAARR